MSDAQNSQLTAIPSRRGPGRRFVKGRSGNPGGRPRAALDVQALARAHTKDAIQTLADCLSDPKHKVAAACALLDRGWGRPAQAILAQVNSNVPQVYEFRWADAKTNLLPGEEANAPTIEAAADGVTNGDAEPEDEGEAEAQEVVIVWGDGTRSG